MRAPTVLVTDADRGSALAIIRSLGRRGWNVIAAGEDPSCIGFRSRHVSERLVVPSPAREPQGFVERVLEAVSRRGVELIVPVTDEVILPLHEARARFNGRTRLAIPEDADALRAVMDKSRTLELAESLGVPTPRGLLATSPDAALRGAELLGWPVVLKPRSSRVLHERGGIDAFVVSYAGTRDDLVESLERLEGRCGVLMQEYCGGVGRGVGLLLHEGRPLAAFQHRRVHEVPITGGASSLRVGEALDPTLYDYSVRILGALRWTGLAMVEFKVGDKGPKLMEVNGRVWGSLPLAVMSGVDFPALLASLYLQGPPGEGSSPQLTYRVGIRARNLALDVTWILTALGRRRRFPFLPTPSRRDGVAGLLALFHPRDRFDVQSLADPRPGLAEIPKILRHVWRKARG
ncbi:MAG TPA: ATP-grasp domain-containing protein [Candidatus Eisenbacteria bacterium]|nr:ATP-grasp domain-containing protein [Candidatus Eisenbacteria bacterium]